MSRIEQVKCDICGTLKKETNHWFSAWVDSNGAFRLFQNADAEFLADICGQQCAIAALNNYLQTGQILPVKAKEPESMEAKA